MDVIVAGIASSVAGVKVKPEDGPAHSGEPPEIQRIDRVRRDFVGREPDQRERWLTSVVGEEERGVGGDAAPGPAGRAAAEELLGRHADEDLP